MAMLANKGIFPILKAAWPYRHVLDWRRYATRLAPKSLPSKSAYQENLKMRNPKFIAFPAVLGLLALSSIAWAWEPARNLAPIFGNFHATPGYEIAVPYLIPVDGNSDGYPEKIKIKFNVYTAGTTTLRRATQIKIANSPAIPSGCTPAAAANGFDVYFYPSRRGALLNRAGGYVAENKRGHIAINMSVECSGKSSIAGFVYSADLSGTEAAGSPGTAWIKAFSGKVIEGLNGEDVDNDLVNELLLVTTGEATATGWRLRFYYTAGGNGATNTTITTSKGNTYTLPASGLGYVVQP